MSDRINDKIINELAKKYNLHPLVIKDIWESQFQFANETISKTDLSIGTDLEGVKTNYRFKFLGTLYISERLIENRNKLTERYGDKYKGH